MGRISRTVFFCLTARKWNALISSELCRAYERGLINSRQMHALAAEFDPTQGGRVGRLVRGERGAEVFQESRIDGKR